MDNLKPRGRELPEHLVGAELKRTLVMRKIFIIGFVCCDLYVAPPPCGILPVFVVSFFFSLQVLIEMDAFRRKGLKLRFRVGQNWKESD